MKEFVVIDLGASSGRVLVGSAPGRLREAARFPVAAKTAADGRLRWDLAGLAASVRAALTRLAEQLEEPPCAVSCDSWSQDLVFLGGGGKELADALCYRDPLLAEGPALLKAAGVDLPGRIATASQLAVFRKHAPRMLAEARVALHIADWVNYLLCGVPRANFSMLSAGRLLDAQGGLDRTLFAKLDIAADLFPPMAAAEVIGHMSGAWPAFFRDVPVVSGVSHDSAAAFLALDPAPGEAAAVLGTWLMAATDAPAGRGTIGLLPGRAVVSGGAPGMWAQNQCIEAWRKEGSFPGFDAFAREIAASHFDGSYRAVWSDKALTPEIIAGDFRRRGEAPPLTRGDLGRALNRGVAEELKSLLERLTKEAGRPVRSLVLGGGGAASPTLVGTIAEVTGCSCRIGALEATGAGNLIAQRQALRG